MDSKEQILRKQTISNIETDYKNFSTLVKHENIEISLDEECSEDTVLVSSAFDMLIG